MNQKNLYVLPILLCMFQTTTLFGQDKEGKKIFETRCASCHSGYIPEARLKENFFKKDNQLLHLKAPTINMLVYGIMRGPKKIGEPGDAEMRQAEIEAYLQEYLEEPEAGESLLSPAIGRYFHTPHPVIKLDENALAHLTKYLMHYAAEHQRGDGKVLKRHFDGAFDLPALLAEAKRSGKTLIVEVSSPLCHYCRKMDREVLNDPEIRRMLQEHFIFTELNVRSTRLPARLAQAYQHITPSFFFLSPEGKLLHSYPGSWTKTDFVLILRENLPGVEKH